MLGDLVVGESLEIEPGLGHPEEERARVQRRG